MKTLATSLQTARLQLDPLCSGDAPDLFDLFHDPAAMPHWHTVPHQTPEGTHSAIEAMLRPPLACWWAVRLIETRETIGFLGFLGLGENSGFGYAIYPAYRLKGYAAEAARAALSFGFRQLDLDRVELWIHERNTASCRLAQSLGFEKRGCFRQMYPREGRSRETLVYGNTRARWHECDVTSIDEAAVSESCRPRFYGIEPILEVADLATSVQFYSLQLGFTVEFVFGDPVSHAGLFRGEWSTQGARLQLTQRAQASGIPSVALYFIVAPRLDMLYEEFHRKNVPIVEVIAMRPWGRREFTVRDPDGYLLRFGEPA
jgi:RimJ/RimL family protein N-acetyltransferase/catechol 2,3-dioxygenase-like lactoylglutathione lyase family enzyme